jgi:endonuclease YncB( thermonuclease family)
MILMGCSKGPNNGLVISKLFDATLSRNNVIELYNFSDSQINLSDYTLRIHTNSSSEYTKEIELSGIVDAEDYFVISGNNPTYESIDLETDFSYIESLPYNGNDAIALYYKETLIDLIGFTGIDISFAEDVTLIRIGPLSSYKASANYEEYNYITYLPDVFQYLANDSHQIKTLNQLLEGPRLEERFLELSYVDPNDNTLGNGGAVKTELISVADGDTAYFKGMNGFPGGSLRYFYLNTPEVDGTYVIAEPWGYVASKYNKSYLLNDSKNKEIYVQSIPGYSLYETNGRNLGLVWINGHLSQFLIVAEGLSEKLPSVYSEYDLLLSYKDIPYLTFLRFAEYRAVQNGWGVKGYPFNLEGEKSPDWNYQGDSNTTQSPIWSPHLDLPWE